MMRGVSPGGRHFYPAFPYTSYARMKPADVADLFAFMKTLPAVAGKAPDHQLGFPFNIRRGLGLWKLLYLSDQPVIALAADAPEKVRLGRYLVEGPGHCGECHTPRDFAGGTKKGRVAGRAPSPPKAAASSPTSPRARAASATGRRRTSPTIWKRGFTPDFDSVGGAMVEVQKNIARLQRRRPRGDRRLSEGGAAACQRLSGQGEAGGGKPSVLSRPFTARRARLGP